MKNSTGIAILSVAVILGSIRIGNILQAQPPTITQAYGLTLERDDFGPVSIVPPGTTTFTTSITTRSNFVIVFRNGLLQRACKAGTMPAPSVCDFVPGSSGVVSYTPGTIQASDLVSMLFYR